MKNYFSSFESHVNKLAKSEEILQTREALKAKASTTVNDIGKKTLNKVSKIAKEKVHSKAQDVSQKLV